MPDTICWLHDEMLRADAIPAGTPALFVFDEAWMADERLSLKRIVFMYESAAELPIEVYKGDPVAEVATFAERHTATRIITHRSPLPRIKRQVDALRSGGLEVDLVGPEPIATLPDGVDLKRFSRYWRKVEKQVMRRDYSGY